MEPSGALGEARDREDAEQRGGEEEDGGDGVCRDEGGIDGEGTEADAVLLMEDAVAHDLLDRFGLRGGVGGGEDDRDEEEDDHAEPHGKEDGFLFVLYSFHESSGGRDAHLLT